MTSRERVLRRLDRLPVDKVPNLNIVMAFAAKQIGASYRQFVLDYRVLAKANLHCSEQFGIDMLSVISDPMREAHDLGAKVVFPEDGVPYSPEPLIGNVSEIARLKIVEPDNGERMADRIRAVERLKAEAGGDYPVLGWVEGPIAEAADLRGLENLFLDFYDNASMATDLLEFCTQQAIAFARAQVEAGAGFIGIGEAAASLIGPAIYEEYVLPLEKRVVDAIHQMGAYAKLHICGNITPILGLVDRTGADIIDVDWMVDFGDAVKRLRHAAACGNFDPVAVMLMGSRDAVSSAVNRCLSFAKDNTFIAAGCEVPEATPRDNMIAVADALAKFK